MATLIAHHADPDAEPLSSPEAIAYAQTVERLGRHSALLPTRQIAYGEDRGQRLDVYAPNHADNLPVLAFLHGGAWISGHLGWLRFMAANALALPMVFVAITYRLAPRCRWPAQFDDVRAAYDWITREIARFGGDPARVVLGGHSAGGHLAAQFAARDAGAILACMPISAPLDLRYGDVPPESGEGRVYKYLFATRSQDSDASPLAHISTARAPFHVVWGERDFLRIRRSGAALVHALTDAGRPVTRTVFPATSHFDTHVSLADPACAWWRALRRVATPPPS